jgi:hypothetical protein
MTDREAQEGSCFSFFLQKEEEEERRLVPLCAEGNLFVQKETCQL